MDSSLKSTSLSHLAETCGSVATVDELLTAALPGVVELTRSSAGLALERRVDGLVVLAKAGRSLPVEEDLSGLLDGPLGVPVDLPVSASWRALGLSRAQARRLPGNDTWLVLAGDTAEPGAEEQGHVALALVQSAAGRLHAESRFDDLAQRVDNAQQLANMGDYDWHISTDTNRWSDQLYRIYGHEPQSFNASYERFLSLLHPEDRERITAVHQQAYATGEPYQMMERVVRPDGQVRYLSSNGQVVMDDSGVPVRMRGTCIDITDRVLAEQERARSTARFQRLVEVSPDAILVVDRAGQVLQANTRSAALLGGDVVGHRLDEILPAAVAGSGGQAVESTGLDGRVLRLDVVVAELEGVAEQDEGTTAVFLHDAEPRLRSEALAARLREAQVRRRQALEINDNIVQGLTVAAYSMEAGNMSTGQAYLEKTLTAARRMMNDLLDPLTDEGLQPGDLVRTEASSLETPAVNPAPTQPRPCREDAVVERESRRVLIVDDYDDVRMLLRIKLEQHGGYDVVGEAGTGIDAVRLAGELQPHLVLLDVAMPQMDGLEALPLIRDAVDGVRVVVLSGFDQNAMADRALAAGAARYVEKGHALADLVKVIDEVLERG